MYTVKYDNVKEQVEISFSGNNYHDIKTIVKNAGFRFNPNKKVWYNKSAQKTIEKVIPELLLLEEGDIQHDKIKKALEKEEENKILSETRFYRNKLLPESLKSQPIQGKPPYQDFQLDSIKKGIQQNRLALFHQMGLGKTFIVISILNQYYLQGRLDKILIVCPGEALYNWRRELVRFSVFVNEKDDVLISTADKNRNPLEQKEKNVVVMTYRHYLTLMDDYIKLKKSKAKKPRKPVIPWEEWGNTRAIVLEESHNCKNRQARKTHAINLHKNSFEYRYLLTGTPTPNSFDEIYPQIKILDENLIKDSYYQWLEKIAVLGDRFSQYTINYFKEGEVKKEEDKFSNHVLRYKSDEVLDLPELYIKPKYVELTDIQKKIYNHIINYVIYRIKKEHGRIVPKEVRNKFAFIVQAYENACLLKGKIAPDYSTDFYELVEQFKFNNKHHAKLNISDSLINEYMNNQKQKVAIMDYHPLTIEQLAEHYKKYNPIVIHGQNTPKGMTKEVFRNEQIEKFKHDKNHNLLIGSSKVLSTAINLTECKRVIYFSRDFSYLSWSQSIKRFHRIGSTERVIINPIISEETLEERVETALKNKKDLDEAIFKKDSITLDEWKNIFKGK